MAQVAVAWSLACVPFPCLPHLAFLSFASSPPSPSSSLLFSQPGVTAPIIGSTSIKHLEDLIGAVKVKLTEEEIQEISEPYTHRPIVSSASRYRDEGREADLMVFGLDVLQIGHA